MLSNGIGQITHPVLSMPAVAPPPVKQVSDPVAMSPNLDSLALSATLPVKADESEAENDEVKLAKELAANPPVLPKPVEPHYAAAAELLNKIDPANAVSWDKDQTGNVLVNAQYSSDDGGTTTMTSRYTLKTGEMVDRVYKTTPNGTVTSIKITTPSGNPAIPPLIENYEIRINSLGTTFSSPNDER